MDILVQILFGLLSTIGTLAAPSPEISNPIQDAHNLTSTELRSAALGPLAERSDNWGGFWDNNCRDVSFYLSEADKEKDEKKNTIEPYLDSPILAARCLGIMGDEKCSRLKLGECLVNIGGYLIPAENGGFHASCSLCRLIDGGPKMQCFCYRDHSRSPQVFVNTINLNDFIHNWDGQLRCFGNRGKQDTCPGEDSYHPDDGGSLLDA